jgi:hypothetical protein
MIPVNIPRHQAIRERILKRPDAFVEINIDLWQRLAMELIPIIGNIGFRTLLERSVNLTSTTYPWLASIRMRQKIDLPFPELKIILTERGLPEAGEASISLLGTFCDILAGLIGEFLATSILNSAWSGSPQPNAHKEISNE